MHPSQRFLIFCITLILAFGHSKSIASSSPDMMPPVTEKVSSVLNKITPGLKNELESKGFQLGAPIFVRIFKLPAELEIWLERKGRYYLFKTFPICDFSGYPGPKLKEGDWQSPEGFYSVEANQMHPRSNYHLAFNIGYPNEYDRHLNRSGGDIMVHGNCSSMGCFAMSDFRMEEIYTLAHASLTNGQESFAVHIFPFHMNSENMNKFNSSPWIGFWRNLKEGYDAFEQYRRIPEIRVANGKYVVSGPTRLALQDKK